MAEEYIGLKFERHQQHQQIVLQQSKYLSGFALPVAAKGLILESFGFQQGDDELSFAAGEKDTVTFFLHFAGEVLEKMNMARMTDVDEYAHREGMIGGLRDWGIG